MRRLRQEWMSANSDLADQIDARSGSTFNRSAGVPPAVSGASRPHFGEVTIRDRGRLPHWEKDNATYFITFRLSDSLPHPCSKELNSRRRISSEPQLS